MENCGENIQFKSKKTKRLSNSTYCSHFKNTLSEHFAPEFRLQLALTYFKIARYGTQLIKLCASCALGTEQVEEIGRVET